MPHVRVAPDQVGAEAFTESLSESFASPSHDVADEVQRRVQLIAWQAYGDSRHASSDDGDAAARTDPRDAASRSRVLIVRAGAQGESQRSARPIAAARAVFDDADIDVDLWTDASIETADDSIADLRARWMQAHAVMIVAQVDRVATASDRWLDRLRRMSGMDMDIGPAHRAYGLIVQGEPSEADKLRRSLSDALDEMGLIDAHAQARLARFIGYHEPYATGHAIWNAAEPIQEEALNSARAIANAVIEIRAGRLMRPDLLLSRPRLTR